MPNDGIYSYLTSQTLHPLPIAMHFLAQSFPFPSLITYIRRLNVCTTVYNKPVISFGVHVLDMMV